MSNNTLSNYDLDVLTLREIHSALNAQEWNSDTLQRIANLIEGAGFYVAEPNEASNGEVTVGHGECACRECAIREALAKVS